MADTTVALRWDGEGQRYTGGVAGGPGIVLDGSGAAGPSPMAALALGVAGCMAIDVQDIAQKMRLPLTGLDVTVEGDRRAEPPRRFTALRLKYTVSGVAAADEDKIWRAIELSREKYCSVIHSMRDDIDLTIELELR